MLDARREIQKQFEAECRRMKGRINRWFLFAWTNKICEGRVSEDKPRIQIVNFASTLGVLKSQINPHDWGLIRVVSSPPLTPNYAGRNALTEDRYYANKDTSLEVSNPEAPFISFDLGEAAWFRVLHVKLDSHLVRHQRSNLPQLVRAYPKSLHLTGDGVEKQVALGNAVFDQDGVAELEVKDGVIKSRITARMEATSSAGGSVLRLRHVEFVGQFLPAP
jgi:hypothetical protein